jgi:hypothetical protein
MTLRVISIEAQGIARRATAGARPTKALEPPPVELERRTAANEQSTTAGWQQRIGHRRPRTVRIQGQTS